MQTDIVQPFGDQIFIAGIEHIGIVEEQQSGPFHQIMLGSCLRVCD